MRAHTAAAVATALLATGVVFAPRHGAVAQSAEPAARQYVVGVSGMH
jgi:hypothetical protein